EDDIPVSLWNTQCEIDAPVEDVEIQFDYQEAAPMAVGYLDYITIHSLRRIRFDGPRMLFRAPNPDLGPRNYHLEGGHAQTRVWEITNPLLPVQWEGRQVGGNYVFHHPGGYLPEWAAWNQDDLPQPEWMGGVGNQNLFGHPAVDYVIVSHED